MTTLVRNNPALIPAALVALIHVIGIQIFAAIF